MITSDNNFNNDQPTKGGAFVPAAPVSGNTFAKVTVTKSDEIMSGDDTTAGPYGGDMGTFGEIYGQDNYGGIVHFRRKPDPPPIAH